MDRVITPETFGKAGTSEELLARFARLLRDRYGATVYLFGSRARGTASWASDYDVVAVAAAFADERRTARVRDRVLLWWEAGGWGEDLDLHCLTPAEFAAELASGYGYVATSSQRAELILVDPASPTES